MDKVREILKNEFVILDGGFGTELQKYGMKPGETTEDMNFSHPEWVVDITRKYAEAGSMIVAANTFGINRIKLLESEKSVAESISTAISLAKQAIGGRKICVALDVGSTGQLLEPSGTLSFEEAYEVFKEVVIEGEKNGADLVVIETMTDLNEVRAAVLAAKENTNLPVFCYMTFEHNGRTFTGCSVSSMALTLEGLGVDAIGVNCSLGPNELVPVVDELLKWTTLPVVVKPNGGLPDPETNVYDISAEEFTDSMLVFADKGVKILGGCCGTTPEFIAMLCDKLKGKKYVKPVVDIPSAVCTPSSTVVINQPRIIGERINPTGKKLFKEALKNNNIDYIISQAIEQVKAGAELLDVNVGLPEIDEKMMMVKAIKAIQSVTETPLQIDSTDPQVIEAALRVYCGKAILNSVNGEEESLSNILPIVKKYGAAVVGLTLDKNGIPKKAEERFHIAEKIVKAAESYGIDRKNVFIDCLTLTASAEQEGVMETLKAVKMVREKLGVHTVLGVSNISFGLPQRELVNSNFLTMALVNGLDLPIMNPNISSMTGAVRAFKLLTGIDKNSVEFIQSYQNLDGANSAPKTAQNASEMTLRYAIENGLKSESTTITERMLTEMDSMQIINEHLIPALDKTGVEFEAGRIFLPQLILSASTAQKCFEVIKNHLSKSNSESVSKGKIVIATVHGDIHDIGKNIVKILLENYGYNVIDLGKDVPEEKVLQAAIDNDVKLVGLSALMTTTLGAMERTIALIKQHKPDCKVMVGGAVLTADYAEKIGADYYSKDAKQSVDIAKIELG